MYMYNYKLYAYNTITFYLFIISGFKKAKLIIPQITIY